MILKRIRIESYQALRNPVEIGGLGVGLHVIHGPNETGKSTLLSAVARAFFDRYNTTDQEMRALRPWGTELGPRVLVEFETAGKTYRLEKRFLDEESSSLSEWSGSRFERIADSVRSDDRVRELLSATASKVGSSSVKNWGLARLLWMTQQDSRLDPPELDTTVRQRLLGLLGSTVLSASEQGFLARLDQAYETFYTAAKQSEKKGSPLSEARERLSKAEQNLAHCSSRWAEVTRLNDTLGTAAARLAELAEARARSEEQIRELRKTAEQERELESRIKLKEQELLLARDRWRSLGALQAEIRGLQETRQSKQNELVELEPKLAGLEAQLKSADALLTQQKETWIAAALEFDGFSKKLADTGVLSELKMLLRQRTDLAAQSEAAAGIHAKYQAQAALYRSRKRPKDRDVKELQLLERDVQEVERRIRDQGIELQIVAERPGVQVAWSDPDQEPVLQQATLVPGQAQVFRSADSGELSIPGLGRVIVRSGSGDVRKLKIQAGELKERLKARLDLFAVQSTEELEELRAQTLEIETEGQALNAALASALGSKFPALEALVAERDRVSNLLASRLAQAGLTEAELEAREASELGEMTARLAQVRAGRERAEQDKARHELEIRRIATECDALKRRISAAAQARAMLDEQVESKLKANGGQLNLEKELGEAVSGKNALEAELEIYVKKLPPMADRAAPKLAEQQRRLDEATQGEQLARQERDRALAILESAQAEGYYTQLARAEEEHVLAQELFKKHLARAQGARVLRSLAQAKRERMNSGLLSPVESAVTRIFDEIRGGDSAKGGLAFGSDIHEIKNLRSLSLGTREQAMLAMRLAIGDLLTERGERPEPELIVLDDPLVNADPERQERARRILAKAAGKMQILVLTARPEDYRALGPKEYDLAALKAQEA